MSGPYKQLARAYIEYRHDRDIQREKRGRLNQEIRGLVGESGSGKSLIAKAICGVAKDNWRVTADRMRFDDIDLLRLSSRERRKLVGHNVSMIFQERSRALILPNASAAS